MLVVEGDGLAIALNLKVYSHIVIFSNLTGFQNLSGLII
jgi:hypothetical protein